MCTAHYYLTCPRRQTYITSQRRNRVHSSTSRYITQAKKSGREGSNPVLTGTKKVTGGAGRFGVDQGGGRAPGRGSCRTARHPVTPCSPPRAGRVPGPAPPRPAYTKPSLLFASNRFIFTILFLSSRDGQVRLPDRTVPSHYIIFISYRHLRDVTFMAMAQRN